MSVIDLWFGGGQYLRIRSPESWKTFRPSALCWCGLLRLGSVGRWRGQWRWSHGDVVDLSVTAVVVAVTVVELPVDTAPPHRSGLGMLVGCGGTDELRS